MRARRLSLMALGLILAGCGQLGPQVTGGSGEGTAAQRARGADAQVEAARLASSLSVLTGMTPAPDGQIIAERGTVAARQATRAFLETTLSGYGYAVERHKYRDNGENVLARLSAQTPSREWVLVGAHFDSVRNAGANDNGTGTTAVLEAARVLRGLTDRKVNVLFAFFDEEELGLKGSRALARDLKAQGLNLTSAHTLDMLGWDKDGDRAIEIERPAGGLWDYYRMANRTHGLNLPLVRTDSGSTDHESFHDEGFDAVGMCEEWTTGDTTPYYHKKTDTYDTVCQPYLEAATRLLVATVGDLALQVPPPPPSPRLPNSWFPRRDHVLGDR